jgi:hypothetical protein
MLPSPSLGPPLLSESLSPALAPCGMPEAAPPDDELVEVAGGVLAAELVLVDELAGGELAVDELELPPPHPATANAITPAASSEVNPKRKFLVRVLMSILICFGGWCQRRPI